MIDPQQAVEAAKAFTKGTDIIQLGVGGIFAVIVIDRVLSWVLKYRKGNGGANGGVNPGYVAQVQDHLAAAILANDKINKVDEKTDKLCDCMITLTANSQRQTEILGKMSDQQIRESVKLEGRG